MAGQQVAHEIGVFLLGASACWLVQTYVPAQEPIKRGVVVAIGALTLWYMAVIAQVL